MVRFSRLEGKLENLGREFERSGRALGESSCLCRDAKARLMAGGGSRASVSGLPGTFSSPTVDSELIIIRLRQQIIALISEHSLQVLVVPVVERTYSAFTSIAERELHD